jgi:hypothetical protein
MVMHKENINKKQVIFSEMVMGTLVYALVLGFFDDYTDFLVIDSYSTTFLVAIVLQVLTYLTLLLKKKVSSNYSSSLGFLGKSGVVFSVWLVLFLSKFVFLAVIDFVFGDAVEISGFVGLLAIIISMTVLKKLIDYFYEKLAD